VLGGDKDNANDGPAGVTENGVNSVGGADVFREMAVVVDCSRYDVNDGRDGGV
jgi:hypothetical protein